MNCFGTLVAEEDREHIKSLLILLASAKCSLIFSKTDKFEKTVLF